MGSYLEYAKKKRKGEEEEKVSSSSNAGGSYSQYAAGKRLGIDTLESDLADMGNTISNIYSEWQTPETMANTRSSVEAMQKRVNDYASYQKKYMPDSTLDVDSLVSGYQSVLDDWDNLTQTYSGFKNADAFKSYMEKAKNPSESEQKKEQNKYALDNAFDSYKHYLDMDNFDELSQYKSTIEDRKFLWMDDRYIGDEVYEYINNYDGKIRSDLLAEHDKYQANTPVYTPSKYVEMGLDYLNEDEKKTYNAIYASEGKEAANKFLEDMKITLNKRATDASAERIKQETDGSVLTSALASIASVPMSVGGGIYSGIENASGLLKGESNPYSAYNSLVNQANTIRESVGENIAESTEGMEVLGQNIPQFLYQTGMSVADSALGVTSLGRAFTPIMGMNAYQQKAKEMTEAGEDEGTVQGMALASGIAEALFEYVSIDKLLKIKNVDGIKNAVKSTLAQMGVEGSEELFTETANILSDVIIRGDGSDIKKQYNDLIAKGYSPSEANTEVAKQIGSQIGWAFVGGALSGGVMGGVTAGNQYHNLKSIGADIRSNDRVSEMMDVAGDAFMSLSEKDAYNLYTEYAKSGVTAENITDVQLGNLYSSVAQNIDDVTRSKKATTQEQNDIRRQIEGLETVNKAKTTKMADTGKAVNIEGVKSVDGERVLQTSEGEVKTKDVKLSHTDAELMSYAEGMDDSKANLMLSQYDGKSDVEAYVNSFNLAYSYGETGFGTDFVLKNKGVLTERQALNAYKEATMAKARKNAEAFENAVNKTITREMLGGRFDDSIIDYDGSGKGTVKWNMLTSSEKMNINAAKVIAGAMKNTKFEFIESRVENGEYKGENARWDPTTRTISIDVHAGRNKLTDENSYIMSAMSHEITHSFERTAAEEYANLRDHVMNYLANRDGIDASELIARKRMQIGDSHAKRGIELTDERVINEIVADACEEMLVNSKKVDEYLKGMDEHTKKSFVGKVKETFENIIKAINDVIKKLDPRTKEARALRESKEDFEKALELWDKAFAKANESHVGSISTDTEINNALNEIGLEYDSETETVFSLRSLEEAFNYNDADGYLRAREEYVNALVKATGRTKAEAERYLNSLFLVHDMIARDKDRLDYEAAVNRTAWVSNSEYGGSIDFSTLCAKRRIFTGTFDAIQNALPNTVLTDKDYLEIRNLLLKKGKESPCSMCYVEGSRAKAGEYINKWLQEYLKTNPVWKPRIADFASATGLERTRIQHPEAYSAYQEAMNKLAQRKPKEASVRTDYKGEILVAFSDGSSVEIKNLNGGIRFNSFSDFEIVHTLDCMQVITDMARVGLAGQGYTKVKEFAKCFGNTGMKINLSLVAKDVDENGKLVMDEVNGMSYKDAMELRNEFSENVGTVIVCFNVDQIKAAMADDTIDYILPFHRSQWRKAQYAAMGLPTKTKDFTMFQNDRIRNPKTGRPVKLEKLKHISRYTNDITGESYEIKGNIMPNQYWDYTKSGRENAQRYLDYINQNGMTPKFDFVLEKADGKWVLPNNAIGDGYFKLLIDFKMYNNDGVGTPQLPVTPEFNMPYIEQMLEDYKGGHGSFPVAHDVVDEFVEGYKKNHPKAQYSDRINTEEQLSTFNLEGKWNDYIGVQKEVVKVLKNEGFFDNNSVVNEDSGMEVKINAKGVRETLSSGNRFQTLPKELKRYKVATIRKLPDLIRTGKLLDDNVKNSHDPNGYRYAYIENNAIVDDKVVGVRIAIKKKVNTNYFWIHNIDTNEKNSELLSPSVRTVLNETRSSDKTVTQDEIKVNIQFSDRYDDVWFDLFDEDGSMAASSAIIDEDVERLRERLSMGASSMSDANIQMIAKHLRKIADSSYDNDELMDELKDIYGYIEHHDYFDGNALVSKCNDVARRILSEQREHKVTNDYAKMVLKDIRATKIKLNAEQIAEAKNRYGEKYRNALFGRITISNEGISLDSKWQEWSGQYPSIFSADVNSADMINELADIYDSLREASETGQRFAEVNDVRALGAEIYNQYWIRSTVQTESEKNQQKVKELNLKHRNAMKKLREDYQKRLENQRLADSMHYGKIINEIRQKNKDEVKKAKELGQKRMDDYKDRVAKKAEIEKITKTALTLAKWIREGSKKNPMPDIMRKPVLKLLDAIDFSSKQLLRYGEPTGNDIKLDEAMRDVVDMAKDIQLGNATIGKADVDAMYINFPDGLVEEIKQLSTLVNNITASIGDSRYVLNHMTLEELESFDLMITTMKHIITEMNKTHTFHYERGVLGFASNMYGFVDNIKAKIMNNGLSDFLEYDNATPVSVFKRMGSYGVTLFKSFQDAQDRFAFNVRDILEYKDKVYKDCGITENDVREWRNHLRKITITDVKNTTDKDNPKFMTITMTDAQIMGLYLLNKREQARKHIYKGGIRIGDIKLDGKVNPIRSVKGFNITAGDVENIISELDDKQIFVADQFSRFLNSTCSDWGNFVTMKLYGMKSFREKFYYPIQIDENGKQAKPNEDDTSIYRLMNIGFTKPITPNANNKLVVYDIFDVFGKHTSDMAKYNAFTLAITDFLKVYNYNSKIYTGTDGEHETESMQTALESAYGKGMKKYLRTFLEDINSSQSGGRGEEFSKKMMSNYKIAAVGANINVAMLQPMSLARAIMVLPSKYIFFRGNMLKWKEGSKKAMKHSGMAVWKSLGFYDTNITRGVQEQITGGQSLKSKIAEKSMFLAELGDRFTWGTLWNACELEVKDRRKDLDVTSDEFAKEVALKFREVVYSTQVVDSTLTRAQIMRSKSALMQTVTAFMSESLLTYNMVADTFFEWSMESRQGNKPSPGKHGRKFAKAVGVYCLTAALSAAVRSTTDIIRDDDEEEEDLDEFIAKFKENFKSELDPLSKLPWAKDVVSVFQGYDPTRMDEQSLVAIKRAFDAWKKVIKDDKDVDYKVVYKTLQAISQISGLPLSNAYRDVVAMWNTSIGNVYPSLKVETK